MRTGGYSSYQTLTPEAAAIVKQALTLAKRRGHAQVTPLHIATTMLSSSTAFLRTACLQSHTHPLQFKALELCFNVALNRLPTSVSSPILGPLSHHPSLSNALVAAFKRAQAHQRRGSVENQQQPILALKIELEQLVISILDDPSVSRVMREAGFSSTLVKTRVEQSVSLEVCSHSTPPPLMTSSHSKENIKPLVQSEDVMGVIESLMRDKRKNTVVVGESLASAESAVKRVIEKFDRGDVPREMRYVQFISLPLLSLKNVTIGEAEKKLEELRCLVKSCLGRGVVLYLGDLKWVSEFWSSYGGSSRSYYCPVEVMIMEISKMLFGVGESGKLWLMGIATSQTYMRCKSGQPSLETLWQLHPLTIPVACLGLSLNLESDVQGKCQMKVTEDESSWLRMKVGVEKELTCCADCLRNFNTEAQSIAKSNNHCNESTTTSTSPRLPSWLQQYKEENQRKNVSDQEFNKLRDISIKWNSICSSVHKKPHFLEKALNHSSSSSPCSSNSISSYDGNSPILQQALLKWPVIFEPEQSPKEHRFMKPENGGTGDFESNSRGYIVEMMNEQKPDLLSNPNSSPNSASCSETEEDLDRFDRFKEANPENLKVLCSSLEKKVPWQREIIQDIASTVLQCRSGLEKRKENEKREETWLFFLGIDCDGKEKVAKELAKLVFGTRTNMVKIGLSNFSSTRADSTDECTVVSNKRARDESGSTYYDRFTEAVKENPSRVFFMEDIEQVDYYSQKGIKRAIQSGEIVASFGDDRLVSLKDAIVIFSCESFSSMSRASSPPVRPKSVYRKEEDDEEEEELKEHASLDLNVATMVDAEDDEHSVSDMGILDLVDRQIIFKIQAL